MLNLPNRKKDRIYIYNKKKYLKKYFFLFIKLYFLLIFLVYIIENNFYALYLIKEDTMEPELKKSSWVFSQKISHRKVIEDYDEQEYLPRGSIVMLNYERESSTLRKFLDFPVFMLTLGLVKLNKDSIIVRRVLGLPNERIKIVDKDIYINEARYIPDWFILYQDSRVLEKNILPRDNLEEIFIPPKKVFVLNDRWDVISDSRTLGLIDLEDLEGFYLGTIWD